LTNILINTMNLEKYTPLAFFSGLSEADIQLLAPYFAPQTWVAGTVVFEQGKFANLPYHRPAAFSTRSAFNVINSLGPRRPQSTTSTLEVRLPRMTQ